MNVAITNEQSRAISEYDGAGSPESQSALQQTRELLEESQRSAHVGTWSWDIVGGSLVWTDELYRIYGLEPGDPLDYPRYLDLVHPDDRALAVATVERALVNREPFAFDHRIVRPDGSVRTLHGRGRVIVDREGHPVRMIGSGQDITERLKADEIERTFAGVWEHAPVGIAVYDVSDAFVCVRHNRRFLDLVGENFRRTGSIAGVPLCDLFDADSYGRVRAVFAGVRDSGEAFAIDEFPAVLLPDPEPRWYQWSLTPIRQGEQAAWLVVTAVEVTGLVRGRRERQALLDAAMEGIFGLDAAGFCTFINPTACRLLGYSAEECLGRNMHELTHYKRGDGSPYPIEECPIYQAFSEGRSDRLIEETLWRKDGSPLHTLYSVASLVDAEGRVTGAVVSMYDIEDRLRAETALRASEERFRTLVDATIAGVVLGDATGNLFYANDAYLRIIGRERVELEAGSIDWTRLTPPEWVEADQRGIAEARERGVSAPYEKEYFAPDGSRVPVLVTVARTMADGQEQLIGTVLDLRERKELERLQRDFLAMVSHDLRSPLTAVRGGTQILQRRREYRESTVEAIIAATGRMARLIDDLADLVRMESGRLELRLGQCDLVAIARTEAQTANQRNERPRVHVEAPDGPVVGDWDCDRLAQVVQNLVGNALEHAPASDVVIRVALRDGEARLAVSDRGPGIDPVHLPQLFERFYRAEATGADGLGLGLYISRMLVEAHGGRIDVRLRSGEWRRSAGGAAAHRLRHFRSGKSLQLFGDPDPVAVRVSDAPVAVAPELVDRFLDDRGAGIPGPLEVGVDVFVVGYGRVEHDALAQRSLVVCVARVEPTEHHDGAAALDRSMHELPVLAGQREGDVESKDIDVKLDGLLDVRHRQARHDAFHRRKPLLSQTSVPRSPDRELEPIRGEWSTGQRRHSRLIA
jgi:PAS domain S-box-containing protein